MDSIQSNDEHQWEWVSCIYDVKRITSDSETIWNLSPSVQLTIPTDDGQINPIVRLKVDMSRNFIYTEGIGWNWHKSWNMPDIICELDIRDPQTNERLTPPPKIYAELQIVKTAVNPTQTFHLLDVGIKGNLRAEMHNGKCIFTGLKFDSTSYNHEHSKFHIVVTMYLSQSKFEFPQILESKISPPIFIDSRKSARDVSKQKKQKIQSYLDPFLPETLEKSFIKRDSKIKFSNEEEISSTIDGFVNYFSAPNIRHKVKHPLFLAIKFHRCISLYINTGIIPAGNEEKVTIAVQKILFESYFTNQGAIMKIKIEQKPLLIIVDTTGGESRSQCVQKQRKILEFLEPLKNDIIEIMIDPVGVPKCFQKLTNISELSSIYKKIYPQLVNQKFALAQAKQINREPVQLKVNNESTPQDFIRKIIKIQGYEENNKDEEYLEKIRMTRGASMNAEIVVNQQSSDEKSREIENKNKDDINQIKQEALKSIEKQQNKDELMISPSIKKSIQNQEKIIMNQTIPQQIQRQLQDDKQLYNQYMQQMQQYQMYYPLQMQMQNNPFQQPMQIRQYQQIPPMNFMYPGGVLPMPNQLHQYNMNMIQLQTKQQNSEQNQLCFQNSTNFQQQQQFQPPQ